jgi:hypothetical protein
LLDNVHFTNAVITITGTGDTTGVFNDGPFRNNLPTVSFSISGGGGSGTFTDAIQVFDNQSAESAGFDDKTLSQATILATVNSAFTTYNLASAIGPLTGLALLNGEQAFATTAGNLIINTSGDSTFTATTGVTATPIPAAFPLFATGLGALGLLGWRRKRKAHATAA